MGTRRRSDFKDLVGSYRKARREIRRVERQLKENRPARIVVNTAVGALAASNPYVGTAMVAYRIGRIGHETSETYRNVHRRTKSRRRARREAIETAAKRSKDFARNQAIDFIVDRTLSQAASDTGREIVGSPLARAAAKSALKEVLPRWES